MDLILWRHADAKEGTDDLPDLERPLTAKGERQAQRMAQWLKRQLPESTRVLVSPAVRTRQTAAALEHKVRVIEALGPDASVGALLHATRWPEAREPVLVVGHQPTLGLAAATLLAGAPHPWAVRKGSVWWIKHRERGGSSEVVLHAVVSPDCV